MKIRRTELQEKDGEFTCQVSVPMRDLGYFLALIPQANAVVDIGMGEPDVTPKEQPRPAPPIDTPFDTPIVLDEKTQVIAPTGMDISKLGLGKGLPREVMVILFLAKDPVFQEWVLEQANEAQGAVLDAVDYAAKWVAAQIGAPSVFEIKPEQYPALKDLAEKYAAWRKLRDAPKA